MRAAVWTDYNKIEIQEVSEPIPKKGWAKIKVMSAGVCITDIHVYKGSFAYGTPPHILGHEIAGEVCDVADDDAKHLIGKRVVIETSVGCGTCKECKTGNRHLCSQMTEIGFTPNSGGYAQYVCAPIENLIEIPHNVSYDEAGIVESVVCPAGSLMRLGVGFGETISVTGVGPAGLAYIQTAKLLGASKVIAIARNDVSLERAKEFGADVLINTTTQNVKQVVLDETNGIGVDLSIEAAGVASTVELAVNIVKNNGRVILYGIPSDDSNILFPIKEIITRQLSVYGAAANPFVWEVLLDFVSQGRINLKNMVSKTYLLEDIEKAFEEVQDRSRHFIKVLIHPWDE